MVQSVTKDVQLPFHNIKQNVCKENGNNSTQDTVESSNYTPFSYTPTPRAQLSEDDVKGSNRDDTDKTHNNPIRH